jgi:hypothetical protein
MVHNFFVFTAQGFVSAALSLSEDSNLYDAAAEIERPVRHTYSVKHCDRRTCMDPSRLCNRSCALPSPYDNTPALAENADESSYCQYLGYRSRYHIVTKSIDFIILLSKMCSIQVTTYRNCRRNPQHQLRGNFLRCATAIARTGQQVCLPPTGQLRDLPLSLDVQDSDVDGRCPTCDARSPSNSSD